MSPPHKCSDDDDNDLSFTAFWIYASFHPKIVFSKVFLQTYCGFT